MILFSSDFVFFITQEQTYFLEQAIFWKNDSHSITRYGRTISLWKSASHINLKYEKKGLLN